MKQKFNKNTFYLYKFLSDCLPIYAFYTILFLNSGLSIAEISLLLALWSIFSIIADIPSGMLADRWNRRNMLVLSLLFKGICFVVWFFSYSFFMFTFGFVFWAISGAFASGTEEGLVYDNLKSDHCEEDFTKVYGRALFFTNLGAIIGIASAGVMANFINLEVIALISAAICFINMFFALQIRERNYYSDSLDLDNSSIFQTFIEAGKFIRGSGIVIISLTSLVLLANIGGYLDEFDALIINDWELNYIWVSVILTIRLGFVAVGDLLAPLVQKKLTSIKQIFQLNLLGGIILIVFSTFWYPYFLLLFGLAFMIMTISEILLINIIQQQIKEEGRATVMSFYGIGQNFVMIGFTLLFAVLAGIFTLQHIYIIISGYCLVGSAFFWLISKSRSRLAKGD